MALENKLYITDVDPSKDSRLRRLSLSKFANLVHKKAGEDDFIRKLDSYKAKRK